MAYQQHGGWIPLQDHNYSSGWGRNPQPFEYKPTAVAPEISVEVRPLKPEKPQRAKRESWFTGLKNALRLWLVGAVVVLLINLVWFIIAKTKYGIHDGYGTIKEGPCDAVKKTNLWLHLLINILSTLLLTGSNAFMATYCSPTRKEVDKCHARRTWLHIGFASLRNLRGIAFSKSLIVIILGISSMPFHLLYNSLVYASLASNSYYWVIASDDFVTGASFDLMTYYTDFDNQTHPRIGTSNPDGSDGDGDNPDPVVSYFTEIQQNISRWERLDQTGCIKAYASAFIDNRRNVVMITSTKNDSNSVLDYGISDFDSGSLTNNWWLCSLYGNDGGNQYCNPQDLLANAGSWTVNNYPIEYCYSEKVEGTCSVRFSMNIMIIVLSFNALKLLAMIWVFFRFDAEKVLASVGDAAASFLTISDHHTKGMCLADRRNIKRFWQMPGTGTLYNSTRQAHWGQAIAKKRWLMFFFLFALALFTILVFGIWGFSHTKASGVPLTAASLARIGFGSISSTTMAIYGGAGNALTMSLIANAPQVALALIYLMYMGIITSMFVAADWAQFGSTAQPLMVSIPKGKQRGTWLLGAPLKFGIPLLILQTLLHWFVSQALFVVQIQPYNVDGTKSDADEYSTVYSNVGYSPIAIIVTVITAFLLVLSSVVFMFFRFKAGSPPVVSTCSAAISASCHLPPMAQDHNVVEHELRWGVTAQIPNAIGHCSLGPATRWQFNQAGPPVHGWSYAGLQKRSPGLSDQEI